MKVREIAERIRAHLKRFEADPKINVRTHLVLHPCRKFYQAGAWASGRYVWVTYIAYQASSALTKSEAERYLAWLDAGNVGRHYAMRREEEEKAEAD